MDQISPEQHAPPGNGNIGLNTPCYAHTQINNIMKQPNISSAEHISSKVILKSNLNMNEKEINSLKSSRNDCLIGKDIEDQLSIKKHKRKHQENKSFINNGVLNINKNQNLRNGSDHMTDFMDYETSILLNSLKKKYKKSVSTKIRKDFDHEVQGERVITWRRENSIIDLVHSLPISMKNEKRKRRTIQNQEKVISDTSNNNQDERVKAQIEHDTSILTNYLNQFDSLTVQLIENIKAKRMKK